ncbi:biogenesis of lysosome-related organelles complex 1 subunit 4-like [Littorina saxatilis]|uniref:Biogenesis of lysosome-related organelles complex 1 subunit 4 n=1 Tax=Littorina saxatilis TaxID=31220 RepID=A0AAN9GPN2_9CAEN
MENRSSSEGSLSSFAADDVEGKSTDVLVEELAGDYSRFLSFDVAKEQGKFSESIETMLTKLEEFCGLVDMIRSDTSLCLSKTMPEIQSKCEEMEEMFDRIDCLESFVGVVKKDVTAMEESVGKAETELTSGTLIKKLSSLVTSKKSSSAKTTQKPQFTPPHIFHTERYLTSSDSADSTASASADTGSSAARSDSAEAEPAAEASAPETP